MNVKVREDIVSDEQPKVKVEVEEEEEGIDCQSNRVDEDFENFTFEEEVKTEHNDTFDVKTMTIGDIEKILQNQSREIKTLKDSFKSKTTELEQCRTTIVSKCLENDMTKVKLTEVNKEKIDLKTTVERLQTLNRTYKARCDSLTRQNSEYEDVNATNEILRNENESLSMKVDDFVLVNEEKERLQRQNENLQRKLEECSKEKESLKELARNKINEMTKEKDKLKEAAKETNERFQTELKTISAARNKAMTEYQRLAGEVKRIEQERNKLVQEKVIFERRARELDIEKSNQQQKINDLLQEQEKILACNQQVAQLNQHLKRKIDNINEGKEDMKVKLLRIITSDD